MTGLFALPGVRDMQGQTWRIGDLMEANALLRDHHYLGPLNSGGSRLIIVGETDDRTVAVQIWRQPTSRRLPSDGSWLELSRWCLTPAAGANAGSRQHRWAVSTIRKTFPTCTTLVSYSDPAQGHTGSLYRACNWQWAPTWLRLRPPPGGHGSWTAGKPEAIKDRWYFPVSKDRNRSEVLRIDDLAAIRHWRKSATETELRWARQHPQLGVAS